VAQGISTREIHRKLGIPPPLKLSASKDCTSDALARMVTLSRRAKRRTGVGLGRVIENGRIDPGKLIDPR
jgi:hypothetical protein